MMLAALMFLASAMAATPFPLPTTKGWHWVDIEGSKCMSGLQTGVYLRYAASNATKLAVYLNGGGACFNEVTCATASSSAHPGVPQTAGEFDNNDERNPLRDYIWLNVPYCTGDVHLGDVESTVAGVKHHFYGRTNIALIMERAKATWPELTDVVVTGESAGGFGAFANYPFIRSHWPRARGVMIDDSGPVIDDEALAPCLQAAWRRDWDLNNALPAGCPCISDAGNMSSGWVWFKTQNPRDSIGLISSIHDSVISMFYSFGEVPKGTRCPSALPAIYDKLEGGLHRLSDQGIPVFMLPGGQHTHTGSKSSFYTTEVSNVKMYEWIAQLIDPNRPDPPSVVPPKSLVEEASTQPLTFDEYSKAKAAGLYY